MDCIYYQMHYLSLNMYTSERIRHIRVAKNMTQNEVASMLDITRQAYGKLENNMTNINIEHLEQLCNIFHVCLADFLPPHLLCREAVEAENFLSSRYNSSNPPAMAKMLETETLLKLISGFAALDPADQRAIFEFINRKLL